MKLARFDKGEGPEVGIVEGGSIYPTNLKKMTDAMGDETPTASGDALALNSVRLLAPIARPGKIFAIGLNYRDHIEESKMAVPEHQLWFSKAVTSVNGPYDPIPIATGAPYVDYEAELVAVIGKRGKYISETEAKDFVFGYCVGNDVTERHWQHRVQQWTLGKSFDGHGPFGPWITTCGEIDNPHALDISLSVNGETRQSSNTKHLVFNIWQQVSHLSHAMTLEPGDIIFTGTPGGVGAAMEPRRFLRPGDRVRVEIESLGHIEGEMTPDGGDLT